MDSNVDKFNNALYNAGLKKLDLINSLMKEDKTLSFEGAFNIVNGVIALELEFEYRKYV